MNTTTKEPSVGVMPQDVAILNLNMLMHVQGKYRKDLAKELGRVPQVMSRMFNSGSEWTFNDVYKAARFVGVSLDTLTDPTLTPAKALAIIGERHNDEGGLQVAVNNGYRCLRSSGDFTLAA